DRQQHDADEEPEAGSGIDHLAKLDGCEAGQPRPRVRIAGDGSGFGCGSCGAHQTASFRMGSALPLPSVRSKNSCSRPEPPAGSIRITTTPDSSAARPTAPGSAWGMEPPSGAGLAWRPGAAGAG